MIIQSGKKIGSHFHMTTKAIQNPLITKVGRHFGTITGVAGDENGIEEAIQITLTRYEIAQLANAVGLEPHEPEIAAELSSEGVKISIQESDEKNIHKCEVKRNDESR